MCPWFSRNFGTGGTTKPRQYYDGVFLFITLRMHYLYIIFSNSLNKFYVGESHNVEERLQKHNNHSYKDAFSNIANDWVIVLSKKCASRDDALFLESFTKRMKSKK